MLVISYFSTIKIEKIHHRTLVKEKRLLYENAANFKAKKTEEVIEWLNWWLEIKICFVSFINKPG